MIEDLYFVMRRFTLGAMLAVMAGNALQAQGTGTPQNCVDPGSNTGDTGCVSFTYGGQQVMYVTVRAGDGNIWLQQNLGSSQVATLVNDKDSYGDLFQWGRWDDGHQKRNSPVASVPQVNRPDGLAGIHSFVTGSPGWWNINDGNDAWTGKDATEVTDAAGIDPCKAIGPEWKMPSLSEWTDVVNIENIANPVKGFGSHLKLPVAGSRSYTDGSFSFEGKRGYYWSSTPTGAGGKYLYIGSTVVNPSAGGPKGQGASVRCIKPAASLSTVETKFNKQSVGMYPNPVQDIIFIKAESNIETVNITNALGQKMKVQFSNNRIDVNEFPSGVYIVELKLKNGQSVSKKVIKD